jgi:hypothetical protein
VRARVCPRRVARQGGGGEGCAAVGGGGWRPEPVRRCRVPGASLLPLWGSLVSGSVFVSGGLRFRRLGCGAAEIGTVLSPPVFAVSFVYLIKERKCESNPSSPTFAFLGAGGFPCREEFRFRFCDSSHMGRPILRREARRDLRGRE